MNSRRPDFIPSDAARSGLCPGGVLMAAALSGMLLSGCVTRKYVEVRNNGYQPASLVEKFKPNPPPSERTELALRSNDLERLGTDSEEAIAGLVAVYEQEPTLETAYALAELNHAAGRRLAMLKPKKSVEYHVTSLDALAPTSPLIPVLAETLNSGQVRYHNIYAVQKKQYSDGFEGDGLVEVSSARRDDFDSQIMIEATHTTAHRHPLAILELRRILLEHLDAVDSPSSIQLLKHQPPSADAPFASSAL